MSKAKKVNQEAILKQIAQLQELLELDKKRQVVEPLQSQLFEMLLEDEAYAESIKYFVVTNLHKFNKTEQRKLIKYYDWLPKEEQKVMVNADTPQQPSAVQESLTPEEEYLLRSHSF